MRSLKRQQMPRRQAGMTLIEVMIAMLLGVFLLGGMLQVFSSSRLTYRVHEATARMQETGRMALETLSRDIRMAGFWGCASSLDNVVNNLDPGGAGFVDFAFGGVEGVEGGAGAADSLTIRGGGDVGVNLQPPFGPQTSSALNIAPGNGLEQDDLVLISDCESADIFQVTNPDPDTSGTVAHDIGAGTPGNFNVTNPGCPGASAHCLSKIYGADASVHSMQEVAYTVGVSASGEPALFRDGQEFLIGVEDLQILYGEDTDAAGAAGTGVANYYVPANQVADMTNVISIRLALVVRSNDANLTGDARQDYVVLGQNRTAPDARLRQVYTSTVAVRNRL